MTDRTSDSRRESPNAPTYVRRQSTLIGAGLMVLSVMSFTCLDTVLKMLVGSHDLWALAWARSLMQVLYLALLIPFIGASRMVAVKRPMLQLVRGFCLAATTVAILLSLRHMTLTQTYVAMLSAPLVAAALSGVALSERTTATQWLWIVAGFAGVVIALDPSAPEIGWFLTYAVAMAVALGAYHVLTRLAARVEQPLPQLFYVGLFATLLLTPALFLFASESLPPAIWGWIALAGAFGTCAHFLLILAFSYAPPAVVSPMIYTQIIWAAIAGYLVFAEVPTLGTFIGALIVAASGMAILRGAGRTRQAT